MEELGVFHPAGEAVKGQDAERPFEDMDVEPAGLGIVGQEAVRRLGNSAGAWVQP